MAVHNYQGKKYCSKNYFAVNDNLTIEQPLQVNINDEVFTLTMRTPDYDLDLVRGLLFTEDVYKLNSQPIIEIKENKKQNITIADVKIDNKLLGKGYLNSRNLLSVASCGICGKTSLASFSENKIKSSFKINVAEIFKMFEVMKKGQPTFHQSGGSHAAAAFNQNNELIVIREDIGRHNAVDKVIGFMVNHQILNTAKTLLVSGRISYEIVSKTFAAKIPILGAVSAPSTLAVDFSKELGITLLGFCRENKATCYAHPHRII